MDSILVGKRIKDSRKAMGYTQHDLAIILNTTHATLSRWESGQVDKMPIGAITKMAAVLGVDPLWLGGIDAKPMILDEKTKGVHFMADIMMACERFDNIGENFTDDDWKEIVAYIKMKAMMRNEKASE